MNMHTSAMQKLFAPARHPSETQADYRARRKRARAMVQMMSKTPGGNHTSRQLQRQSSALKGRRRFADVLMRNWALKRRDVGAYLAALDAFYARHPG